MKKIFLSLALLSICIGVFSQTHISNNNEIFNKLVTINNGLMIPASANTGEVLTAVNDSGRVGWLAVTASAWGLTGNAGTSEASNFLGTTDGHGLVFKMNNARAGIITVTNSNTSFGSLGLNALTSGIENSCFGYQSGNLITTGNDNSLFGMNSGKSLVTGSANSFFGVASGFASTGSINTGVGFYSLILNTTGNGNTGIGDSSLYKNTTASYNTAIGRLSGKTLTTGSRNTLVGTTADVSGATVTDAVSVGYGAISGSTGIAIGLATAGSAAIAIGTATAGNTGIAIGNAVSTGTSSIAIGDLSVATDGGTAIGVASSAGTNCVGLGGGTGIANQIAFGTQTEMLLPGFSSGTGYIMTDMGSHNVQLVNHIGTQANHLLYAYIDTIHTNGTSLYIGNAHLSQTTTGTGFTADSIQTTWKGDLLGTNTTEPTVTKIGGVAVQTYVRSKLNTITGTGLTTYATVADAIIGGKASGDAFILDLSGVVGIAAKVVAYVP